jgi:hypothetical protein
MITERRLDIHAKMEFYGFFGSAVVHDDPACQGKIHGIQSHQPTAGRSL